MVIPSFYVGARDFNTGSPFMGKKCSYPLSYLLSAMLVLPNDLIFFILSIISMGGGGSILTWAVEGTNHTEATVATTAAAVAPAVQKLITSLPQVPQEVAHGWCKAKDMPYFEVSAKNDINVVQAFEVLASQALLRVSDVGVEPVRTALGRSPRDLPKKKTWE